MLNNHVHAFAYHNIWNAFTTPIMEGRVYIFDQFGVKDAFGNLKPVQSHLCIRFIVNYYLAALSKLYLLILVSFLVTRGRFAAPLKLLRRMRTLAGFFTVVENV